MARLGEGRAVDAGPGETDEFAQRFEAVDEFRVGAVQLVAVGVLVGCVLHVEDAGVRDAPGDEPVVPGAAAEAVRVVPGRIHPPGRFRPIGVLGVIGVLRDGGHRGHLSFCSTDSAAISSAWDSGCTSSASSGASLRSRSTARTLSR